MLASYFILTNNVTFNPGIHILIQQHTHTGPVLQISEEKIDGNYLLELELEGTFSNTIYNLPKNEIDGLNHHLLNFLTTAV